MHGRRPRAAAVRMLGVFALLLGVLSMHGLSMGHDPSSMSAEMSMPAQPGMSVPMPATEALSAVGAELAAVVQGSMPAPVQGPLAHVGAVCVAVLTGGLSLTLMLLALRRSGRVASYDVPLLAAVVRRPARAAPPPRPSLTTLCLSRT